MTDNVTRRHRSHLVRPRWVWGGLVVGLIGVGLLGWAIAVLSWAQSVASAALLLLMTESRSNAFRLGSRPGRSVRSR
jgi:hypothetical protein